MSDGCAAIQREEKQAGEMSQQETRGVQQAEVPRPTPGQMLCKKGPAVLEDKLTTSQKCSLMAG